MPADALESGRAVVGWESEVRCAAGGVQWPEAAEREPPGPVLIGGGLGALAPSTSGTQRPGRAEVSDRGFPGPITHLLQ